MLPSPRPTDDLWACSELQAGRSSFPGRLCTSACAGTVAKSTKVKVSVLEVVFREAETSAQGAGTKIVSFFHLQTLFSLLSIFTGQEEAVTVVRGSDRSRGNLGRSKPV